MWDAWCVLSQRRGFADGGPMPVQSSEIRAHALLHGLSDAEAVELDRYISALDSAFFGWRRQTKEAERIESEKRAQREAAEKAAGKAGAGRG